MRLLVVAEREDLQRRWRAALADMNLPIVRYEAELRLQSEDLVLVHWSGLGASGRKALLEQARCCRLIVLVDEPRLEEGERLLSQGVFGYLNTFVQPGLLPEVIRTVVGGDLWVLPELMQRLLKRLLRRPERTAVDISAWGLSQRELEVLAELSAGKSNKVIARGLAITERTVKAHVSSILDKAGVQDRIQLILKLSGAQPSIMIEREQEYEY